MRANVSDNRLKRRSSTLEKADVAADSGQVASASSPSQSVTAADKPTKVRTPTSLTTPNSLATPTDDTQKLSTLATTSTPPGELGDLSGDLGEFERSLCIGWKGTFSEHCYKPVKNMFYLKIYTWPVLLNCVIPLECYSLLLKRFIFEY